MLLVSIFFYIKSKINHNLAVSQSFKAAQQTLTDSSFLWIKWTGTVQKRLPLSHDVQKERKWVQQWSEKEDFHLKWKSNLQREDERLKHQGIPYHRLWPFQPTSVQRRTILLQKRELLKALGGISQKKRRSENQLTERALQTLCRVQFAVGY